MKHRYHARYRNPDSEADAVALARQMAHEKFDPICTSAVESICAMLPEWLEEEGTPPPHDKLYAMVRDWGANLTRHLVERFHSRFLERARKAVAKVEERDQPIDEDEDEDEDDDDDDKNKKPSPEEYGPSKKELAQQQAAAFEAVKRIADEEIERYLAEVGE